MQLTAKMWWGMRIPLGIDFTTAATEIRKHFRIGVTVSTHSWRGYIDLRPEGPSLFWPRHQRLALLLAKNMATSMFSP